uniref:Ribonuclease A-domain domain-containing protein n=1 Tax=Dicentrarchus labrax TaxID=13489 RepID=A0A8P4G4I7_DICLA
MTGNNCDTKMRPINEDYEEYHGEECKSINTFIVSNDEEVGALCNNVRGERKITSGRVFTVVICRFVYIDIGCHYRGKTINNYAITIICKNGKPVHYRIFKDDDI